MRRLVAPLLAALLLLTGCSSEQLVPDAVPKGAAQKKGGAEEADDGAGSGAPSAPADSPAESPAGGPVDPVALRKPSGRLLGVASEGAPGDLAPVTAFAAKAGKRPDLREYYLLWGTPFDRAGNAALRANGQVPLVSWVPGETTLTDIAAGTQDEYLADFAEEVAAYREPLVLAFAPEMNSGWNRWGVGHATPADYVKAWRHVHGLFRRHGAVNVVWLWTPHVSDQHSSVAPEPYYPGDEYTDWVGLVGYYGPEDGKSYASLFAPAAKELRTFTRKPLLISETGVAEDPRKPAQIADLFAGAERTEGLIGLVWYDLRKQWPGSKYRTDWRVDSSAAAAAALGRAVAGWTSDAVPAPLR
ncbi:glycoside hydrolase family 26 protein [Kitasatospora sp. NPDC096147]|uniref:glycoside hydrolase family 26 protein n=1 Tax=Kitasatospora sp. NPDC096147 TaxID=3364093 RepID=UPI0038143EE0